MEILQTIGQWSWFVVWAGLLILSSLLVYLGLGGNFILLGLALVHALVTGFAPIGWGLLALLAGLALMGEGIEFLVGTFYAARKGATKSSLGLAFVGGLLGAAVGNALLPLAGAVLGSFVGAFAGAVVGQYRHEKRLDPSFRIGGHAFLGRLLAILIKHLLGLIMVFLILRATYPG